MSTERLVRYDAKRDRLPLVSDLNRRADLIEQLTTQNSGGFGVSGQAGAFEPEPDILARITGATYPTIYPYSDDSTIPPYPSESTLPLVAYSWQRIELDDVGFHVWDDPNAGDMGNADFMPAYETSGNWYVPVDGSAIVSLKRGREGEYMTFSLPSSDVMGIITETGSVTYSWQGVVQVKEDEHDLKLTVGGTEDVFLKYVPFGGKSGGVNKAINLEGDPTIPVDTFVWLKRGQCNGYAYVQVSVEKYATETPQLFQIFVINAVGGVFRLSIDSGQTWTNYMAHNVSALDMQAELQLLDPTLDVGGGTSPYVVTVSSGNNLDMVADFSLLKNSQTWLFSKCACASAVDITIDDDTIYPDEIQSAEEFGEPTLTITAQTIYPDSIASAEAFGSPTISSSGSPQTVSLDFCTGTPDGGVNIGDTGLNVQNLTLAVWVKMCSTAVGTVMEKWLGFTGGWRFMIGEFGSATNRPSLSVENTTSLHNIHSSIALTNNVWHHVAVTWDGTTAKVYVDGALDTGASESGGALTISYTGTDGWAGIGYIRSLNQYFLDGKIADMRFYDSALDATAISEIYNSGHILGGAGSNSASLKGWWKMDEGSGTTAADSSGSSNTGTIVGTANWASDVP